MWTDESNDATTWAPINVDPQTVPGQGQPIGLLLAFTYAVSQTFGAGLWIDTDISTTPWV